jgi:predicted nucleotide-binding protein
VPPPARPKVFVVHGRDPALLSEVARFLETGGAEAVILKEQSAVGQILIDEFIRQARDVRFAVVLATADDEGRPRGSEPLHPRARQNVVLELGYFLAKLEKSRIAILADEGLELASDYSGVIYIPWQSGDGWRVPLAKAMRGKVIPFNVNKALGI